MCGRFSQYNLTINYARQIGLQTQHPGLAPRYNVPPGQWILGAAGDPLDASRAAMQMLYWGFVPSWGDQAARAQINARSETAHSKRFWRKAFRKRRCVVAADSWFEWRRGEHGKQPYAIRPVDGEPFFFAGLWSLARNLPSDHPASGMRTAAILTTAADPSLAGIHQRMPIALTPEGATAWLADGDDIPDLQQRLVDGQHDAFDHWPVSKRINMPANNDAALLDAISLKP